VKPSQAGIKVVADDPAHRHRMKEGPIVAQYTTSDQAMASGASKVEDATVQIAQVLQTLDREVTTMTGGWKGDGANSFMQVHEAFTSQANKINTALKNMHEALVANRTTYVNQESDQSSSFNSMAGRING
jgi:WXG100 family type VII secretion target